MFASNSVCIVGDIGGNWLVGGMFKGRQREFEFETKGNSCSRVFNAEMT